MRHQAPLCAPPLATVLLTTVACAGQQPEGTLRLTPRVRTETIGGRVELGKPIERFVMMVARALPTTGPRERDVEAFLYLPQTTTRQTVRDLVCVPPPNDIVVDKWGNQVARFVLGKPEPGKSAHACWMARVSLREMKAHLDESVEPPPPADEVDAREQYLADGLRYVLTAPTVTRKADEVTTGSETHAAKAAAIHKYLAANLVYERIGAHDDAPTVLKRGTGSCSEKAFCWIALARAEGIPARYTGSLLCGADYARFDTVHHRWTEIFLPRWGWLPVDQCYDDFGMFRVRSDKLQLCWCGEGEAPMNWNYIGRTIGGACEKFICPTDESLDFDQLVELTKQTFGAASAEEQKAVLAALGEMKAPETIPLLQTLLCSSENSMVEDAAAGIFAVEPRAARQVRSFVRRLPTAWETMCDAFADSVGANRAERHEGEWVEVFNGHDLEGWTGDLDKYAVVNGALRNSGPGTVLSPYSAGRWYEAEMELSFTGTGRVSLVFASMGDKLPNLQIPFRTEPYKKHNHLFGAASRVGVYSAAAGKRHKAHVLVADDRLWFALNGNPVFSVRNFAVAPGRLGVRTWRDETTANVTSLRVRELAREQITEAVGRATRKPS